MIDQGIHERLERFEHAIHERLERIEALLHVLKRLAQQENEHMSALDDQIQALTDQVTANTTLLGSADVMINGIAAKIDAAVAAATAAGATPAQLASMSGLATALKDADDQLSAALVANTPAAASAKRHP